MEVAYEHYRGSYGQRIMYTPVVCSGALLLAGVSAAFSRKAARTLLPAVSAITLVDCGIGFIFHIRGIQRKPGGWRLPVFNIVMGPPLFAPLLFGMSAYLGLVASFLRREESSSQPPQGDSGLSAMDEAPAAEIARRGNYAGARGAGRKVSKASRGRDGRVSSFSAESKPSTPTIKTISNTKRNGVLS